MKIFFGFLFLVLSGILVCIQLSFFPSHDFSGGILFLLFLLTALSLLGSILIYTTESTSRNKVGPGITVKKIAGAVSMLICVVTIVGTAIIAITDSPGMSWAKYTLDIIYIIGSGTYGAYGLFSDT